MYLSSLMIDTGDNPDRPRPGRLWLRDIYRVHQRLSMAFVPKPKGTRSSFLFRIDNRIQDNSSRAVILVQSQLEPDWRRAFENVNIFLAAAPEVREYEPSFPPGQRLRFRIRMNLAKKAKTAPDRTNLTKPGVGTDSFGRPKSQSKRLAVTWNGDKGQTPDGAIRQWFREKAQHAGFELDSEFNLVHLGWVTGFKPGPAEKDPLRFRSALLEGALTVLDEALFARTLASGFGSAKAFGFGLLSVTPRGITDVDP